MSGSACWHLLSLEPSMVCACRSRSFKAAPEAFHDGGVWAHRSCRVCQHSPGLLQEARVRYCRQGVAGASSKAVAALESCTCAGEVLLQEVGAVYSALKQALRQGAYAWDSADDDCRAMLRVISRYDSRGGIYGVEWSMGEMYKHRRPFFILLITLHIEIIYKASIGAPETKGSMKAATQRRGDLCRTARAAYRQQYQAEGALPDSMPPNTALDDLPVLESFGNCI